MLSTTTCFSTAADLSVVIATRDRPQALAACLDALAAGQERPGEIIVVDQSRQAQTQLMAAEKGQAIAGLRYCRQEGSGLGAAQNLGVAHATRAIIAVTDDDCMPAPDWAARMAQAFARPEQPDVVTGRVLPLGPDQPGRYAVACRTSPTPVWFDRDALPWDIGSGNNFAVKGEWLRRVGGVDERLGPGSPGLGGVDMDLFYRLLRAGARMRYDPQVVVWHARTDKAGRLARRFPYGFGMGACVGLWLGEGDGRAWRVLRAWLRLRLHRLLSGARQRDGLRMREEALVLTGTGSGWLHGWRTRKIEKDEHPLSRS